MPEQLLAVAKPKKRSRTAEFPIDPSHWCVPCDTASSQRRPQLCDCVVLPALLPGSSPLASCACRRLSKGVLANTASTRAGLSQDDLHRCIDEIAEFMKSSRAHLKLPQATIATAIVFFQRYVVSNAVRPTDMRIVADACVFLAAKAEDTPKYPAKSLDTVIKAMHKTQVHADAKAAGQPTVPSPD
eukprot:COSAG06_NODE_6632_length_2847_cov_2.585153_4_plen_185_part_01